MTYLKSPIFWTIALVVAASATFYLLKSRGSKQWGFKELVKYPRKYLPEMAPSQQTVQRAISEAQGWSPHEIESNVRWFILNAPTTREASVELQALRSLGNRTHPAVFRLLGDVGLRAKIMTSSGGDMFPESPFKRACIVFGEEPPVESIAALAPFLEIGDERIKKEVVFTMGKTGHPSAAPYLKKALRDADEYVRSSVLIGVNRSLEQARLAPELISALFLEIQQILLDGKNADKAAQLLVSFDRKRATELFLSDVNFSVSSPVLHEMIRALTASEVNIPREKLTMVINALGHKPLKYPESYLLREALHALGRHQLSADRALLEAYLSNKDSTIAQGAASGLISSWGLDGFEGRIWDKEEKSGYNSLTLPQRYYSAVTMCDVEINNGGLSQYFFNSAGDHSKDALDGFEAMGLPKRSAILREAIALFGSNGPSQIREKRMDQLSKIVRENDQIFDGMGSRYYESKEVIEVGIARYVINNADAFR